MFTPQTSIAIAEPIDIQIGGLGNNIIPMYQFICIINAEKVIGLESILNYMHENLSVKMTQP